MEAKYQRENLSPSRGEAMEEEAQGGDPPPLSRWRQSAVIVFINITIFITFLISFRWSTLPHLIVIPYLNMVLYATYYDPMMCYHPMIE